MTSFKIVNTEGVLIGREDEVLDLAHVYELHLIGAEDIFDGAWFEIDQDHDVNIYSPDGEKWHIIVYDVEVDEEGIGHALLDVELGRAVLILTGSKEGE